MHELYFDGLTPKPAIRTADIRAALAKRFGSLDRWIEDFKVCCMAANGWGILVRDMVNGRLYNVASDLHEVGVIWLGQPLVVCDVYEHAFYVDYRTASRSTSTSSCSSSIGKRRTSDSKCSRNKKASRAFAAAERLRSD